MINKETLKREFNKEFKGAVITRHVYQKSLIPCLIIRNRYERIWVNPYYWVKFPQVHYIYRIVFHGRMDNPLMGIFMRWVKENDQTNPIVEEDYAGILRNDDPEPNNYHCWCELMTCFMTEMGAKLIHVTDKTHHWR